MWYFNSVKTAVSIQLLFRILVFHYHLFKIKTTSSKHVLKCEYCFLLNNAFEQGKQRSN